jgi:acetyl esterase
MSPQEARVAMIARSAPYLVNPPAVAEVVDRGIPGPAGTLPVRIYKSGAPSPAPVLVYFHGGGWVCGNLDTHDSLCRALANAARCVVVSVDYRLAPEHPFPAPVEDAYAATAWVSDNGARLGADPTRLAVGGDSAGGALAAAVCLMARDRGGPAITCQLLNYPATDYAFDTASYVENASGYQLTREGMIWFWNHYLATPADGCHPYASPLRAEDFSGLPPAIVITAEFDPLRDEGEEYARRLMAAGVPVHLLSYPGLIHNFVRMFPILEAGRAAIEETGELLRSRWNRSPRRAESSDGPAVESGPR